MSSILVTFLLCSLLLLLVLQQLPEFEQHTPEGFLETISSD